MNEADIRATQIFVIREVIAEYCGTLLTPDTVDKIVAHLQQEMRSGRQAWAFARTDKMEELLTIINELRREKQFSEERYALETAMREKELANWKDRTKELSLELHCYREARVD